MHFLQYLGKLSVNLKMICLRQLINVFEKEKYLDLQNEKQNRTIHRELIFSNMEKNSSQHTGDVRIHNQYVVVLNLGRSEISPRHLISNI